MVKTIKLTGAVRNVQFSASYPYYWIDNKSSGTVYASLSEPVAEADGTYAIDAGAKMCIPVGMTGGINLLGEGKVQVLATGSALCPFKSAPKGGEALSVAGATTLTNTVEYPILSLNLYGNSVQDGTPTEETPVDISCVGDDGTVSITSCGSNLAEISTSVCDVDGQRITMKSTAGSGQRLLTNPIQLKAGQTIYLNFILYDMYDISADRTWSVYISDTQVVSMNFLRFNNYNFGELHTTSYTATEDCTVYLRLWGDGTTVTTFTFGFWANIGEASEFEPYVGTTASITSGLPLCSVGDVCDELCFNADGTGKVIKRTAVIDSYDGEEISGEYLSSTGGLTTGARVIYVLNEAVEVELTAAEITALLKLQTFDYVTNIYNDEGADMDVKILTSTMFSEYVMHIMSGMKKRIDALEAAVLSLGGNI